MPRYHRTCSVIHVLIVDAIFIVGIFTVCLYLSTRYRPTVTDALTDEQRKEIENLREELEEAFDKDEERTMTAHGVITQPEWTKNENTPHKSKSKVVVTKNGLDEAKAIRDQIGKAVKQDRYTPNVSNGNTGGNTQVVQELHHKYVGNENNRKSQVGNIVSAATPSEGPNLIETSSTYAEPEIDIRKLQRLEVGKRRTKEMLILESIEEDLSFDLGEHVEEWAHIIHAGQEYFIGRLEEDLEVVHKNALHYDASERVHIGSRITYLETYTFWNPAQQQQEGIIIISTGNQVLWYRADEKSGLITQYWQWIVGTTISGLTYFSADGLDYLVVSSNQSSLTGHYALNIYQFDLNNKEFWITQRLQLAHPCGEVTFLNTGRDYILAVPQNNTALIYAFNPHNENTGHVHFKLKRKFDSKGIEYITAFQMGGRSYLALGGMQPQILVYQQGQFIPKTVFGNNFGSVDFFFPIPVRTYRDDLILLVQHRVDFSTHKLTVLETLIWNGETFETTIPAPCKLGSQIVYGVNCMLDMQRDAGLKGAALLRRGEDVSVIVPRHETESGLFRLHTKLLEKNSELKDLQDIFDFLKEWVAEQDALIAQAQSFLSEPINVSPSSHDNLDTLQLLKTPELFYDGALNELYVKDYKWTDGDSAINLNHIMNEIDNLEQEMSPSRFKRNVEQFEGHSASFLSFHHDEVEAEFLEILNLNGEPFYVQNGSLDFDGILSMVDLEVLESENIKEGRQEMYENVEVENDLEFEKINGILWRDIVENIVYKNTPLELESLKVKGEVSFEEQLELSQLNSLRFPEDYLWTEGFQNQIVNAEKTFTGTLAANHVDTEGYINGKDPLDIVTLSDPQDWNGLPIFTQLEVSEQFELNGTAKGRGLEDFPRNPTLEQTKVIDANCEFVNLKVLGPIKIQENFNGEPLDKILTDIVQRPENPNDKISILSEKSFTNVEFPISFHVLDKKISNIAIDQFIPRQTDQELSLTNLEGYVYFANLTLTGSYDGVLIDELMRNAFRIDVPQNYTNTQLNFVGSIRADTINILNTLNGVPIAMGYQTLDEDLITPKAYFQNLRAKEVDIPGDISGTSKLNGIELKSFLNKGNVTASLEKARTIFLDELVLEAGLQVDEIHGLNADFLYEFLANFDSLPEMVLAGKIHVDRVIVSGDVRVNKLQGQRFDDDIQLTAIWLDRPNYLSSSLKFVDKIDIQGALNVVGYYNNLNLPEIIDDMVFRNVNGTVLILAPKQFSGHVQVLGNTRVDALNGIPFGEYANLRRSDEFEGSLRINGNLIVQELVVEGALNGFTVQELSNQIRFEPALQAYILQGVTNLPLPLNVEDLTVYGDLNEFKQLKNFFDSLVYKRSKSLLYGHYNFTGRVSIENGAFIENLNSHNLVDLFQNIIFIDGLEQLVIDSPIHFSSEVKATRLNIQGNLRTNNLNGCKIKDWLNDTLNVHNSETIKNLIRFAPGSLHCDLHANFLNDIDLLNVVALNAPQNLTENLCFSEVYLDGTIKVRGPVNNVDLQRELENTLLISGNQHIQTPLNLHTVNVLQNLQTKEPINGDKRLEEVATLYENPEFESPFFFEDVRAKNVLTDDLISGINFNDWYESTLWQEGRKEHRINGNWSVGSLVLKNGPNMMRSARTVTGDRNLFELCQQLKKLFAKHSRRSYVIKYMKKAFELELKNLPGKQEIHQAFMIKNYWFINIGCNTTVFKWSSNAENYELKKVFESGLIKQLAVVADNTTNETNFKFMSNSEHRKSELNCKFNGQNLWKFKHDEVMHLKTFNANITELWAAGTKGHIFAITDGGVKKISTTIPYAVESLKLSSLEAEVYRFVGQHTNYNILYDNNTNFEQFSQDVERKRRVVPQHKDYFTKTRVFVRSLVSKDESILRPNDTLVHTLTFADFSHAVERILEDLDYRLGIEIDVTQLSIPETDLYDAHLIEDFIAIIEELRSQKIYPTDTFIDFNTKSWEIPENPAEVLAARTVQIIWPVIVEIDEIHQYLRGNSTAEHPAYGCIVNHLGLVIKEVLSIANTPNQTKNDKTFDNTAVLRTVINRIRQFQNELKELETELKLEIIEDLDKNMENEVLIDKNIEDEKIIEHLFEENSKGEFENHTFSLKNHTKAYGIEKRELINLEVGPEHSSYNLMAVAYDQSQKTPGRRGAILIYTDVLQNDLFQFIPTNKPRSLTTLRIRDITLLAYVENCCTMIVLQYNGVEGFVNFAKLTSKTPINHLMGLDLPHADYGQRYYFVTVLSRKLIFYEVTCAGLRAPTSTDRLKCMP